MNTMVSKLLKLSALSASMALALSAGPAYAGHAGPTPDAGPTFLTSETCVLNRLGAGDCIISGSVATTELFSSVSGDSADNFPQLVSGTYPTVAGAPISFVSNATLTAASITGSPNVSVIGFGCNNTATSPGAMNPCYINVAVRAGGVVGGVVQGELSYTYSALSSQTSDQFVQTGLIHPLIETSFDPVGVAPPPANPGQFLVNNGPVGDGTVDEWDYYSTTTQAVGYDEQTDAVLSSVTVDPPVSSYLNVDVGGEYSSSTVILGSDGQRVGDADVLGSNSPSSFGLSEPSSSVPEPTTLGLMGLGAIAALFGRKRRGIVGV